MFYISTYFTSIPDLPFFRIDSRKSSPLPNVENPWTSHHDHLVQDVDGIGETGFDEDGDHIYVLSIIDIIFKHIYSIL